MSPQTIGASILREAPLLHRDDTVRDALRRLLEAELPALPVADERGELCGIFGEREFITALFPGYLNQLRGAHFIRRSLDDDLEQRAACGGEPVGRHMHTEHIDVAEDYSDAELAEIFLHHRVLLIPVVDGMRRPVCVITRSDFFRALAERFLTS